MALHTGSLSPLSEAALATGTLSSMRVDCSREHPFPCGSFLPSGPGAQVEMTSSPGFGDLRPLATALVCRRLYH